MRRFLCVAAFLLAGVTGVLCAQEQTASVFVDYLGDDQGDPLIEDIVVSTLTATLDRFAIPVLGEPLRPTASGASGPSAPEEARIARLLAEVDPEGAAVVAAVFYLLDGDQIILQYALYDPEVDTVLGGVLTRAQTGPTIFTSVEDAAADFAPAIERYASGRYRVETPPGVVERIVVSGPQEGSDVFIISGGVGRIAGGQLVVPYTQYEQGDTVPVDVRKAGYHPYSQSVLLDQTRVEIQLPRLVPEARFDASLRWSFGMAAGFGADARIHLRPDVSLAGAEIYRLLQVDPNGRDVRHYDLLAKWTRYLFFGPRSPVGLSLGIGVGVIITDVDQLSGREYVDWYVAVGDPTVELRLGPASLYGRVDFFRYAFGAGYNLLGRTWLRTPYGVPPATVGVRWRW